MDSTGSHRPQRRTALVGRELGRYGIQIGALSEIRFADVGHMALIQEITILITERRTTKYVKSRICSCKNQIVPTSHTQFTLILRVSGF